MPMPGLGRRPTVARDTCDGRLPGLCKTRATWSSDATKLSRYDRGESTSAGSATDSTTGAEEAATAQPP